MAAQQQPADAEKLGNVHFPVSCGADAQRQFDRALAMLHSFWYPQGLDAFTALTDTNPDCAMAYWGIAMSARANPLVGSRTRRRSIAAGRRLKKQRRRRTEHRASATTWQRWKLTIRTGRSVTIGRECWPTKPRWNRSIGAIRMTMKAALFYALAINEAVTVLPADKSYARPLRAGQILERVLAAQPDHPGALHYLIHSYDFPPLAARGLPAAERYADVAPSAPHALHMPSHVFSMLGMWQESIRSNQASLRAAKTYVHAMDFMMYAYLQGAQDREAKRLVDESGALQGTQAPPVANSPTGGVLAVHTAFAAIPARYALERGQWAEARALDSGLLTPPLTRSRISLARWVPHAAATLPGRDRRSSSWSLFATRLTGNTGRLLGRAGRDPASGGGSMDGIMRQARKMRPSR